MGFAKKEYEFLSEIGIEASNPGCFANGVWKGNGGVVSSVNPSTNQTIAQVSEGSLEDYEEGMQACSEATKIWMQVSSSLYGALLGSVLIYPIADLIGRRRELLLAGKLCPWHIILSCLVYIVIKNYYQVL